MRTNVTLEFEILEDLLKTTKAKNKTSAVKEAIGEYLRRNKIKDIKAMKGRLEFDMTAEEIRHRER
jgi:hypothetical protein